MTMDPQLSGFSLLQSNMGGLMSEPGAAYENLFHAPPPFFSAALIPTSTAAIPGSIHEALYCYALEFARSFAFRVTLTT